MRVRDAEQAVELANDGPYGLQASVWTRDERSRRGDRAADRGRGRLRQRRPGQLRRARAADGRLEGLGPRLAPRPRRDPQVHEAPVADGHARLRAGPRRPPLPLQRRGERRRSARRSRRSRPATCSTTASGRRSRRSATRSSRRSSRPRARTIRTGSGPGRRATRRSPRGSRSRCCRPSSPEEQIEGLRDAARRARRERDGRRRRRRSCASRSSTAFSDQSPEALAGITTLRGIAGDALLRAARPRHRAQPDLGRDRLPGPACRRRRDRERPLRMRRAGGARRRSRPTSASSARAPAAG